MIISGDQKTKQLLSLSYAKQLWDEWELRCLVLASFGLQAFFLFFAGLRRRNASTVLRILLWLAYLSADYVAVYVLGHMTLKIGDEPRHEVVLLWAPVLLLHLGGQETITAFSMEDNELWKRHLLGLVTQVVLAVYVVARSPSWRRGNGELLAPVVLMFVSGTIKYAERTWALKTATLEAIKGSRMGELCDIIWRGDRSQTEIVFRRKWWLEKEYADLVEAAGDSFPNCINALMGIPVAPWLGPDHDISPPTGVRRPLPEGFPSRAYKMGEIQLSLMYDHLYTKVGLRYAHAQRRPAVVVFTTLGLPLLTLATTSSALALFATTTVRRSKGGGASSYYSAADVAVSYVLLAGAVALDVLSILTFLLSFRSYCFLREKLGARSWLSRAVFWSLKSVRPYHKPLWSNKWAQYNLLVGCIREKQAGCLARMMRRVGVLGDTQLRPISDRTKELICNELNDRHRLDQFGHVRGQGVLSPLRCMDRRRQGVLLFLPPKSSADYLYDSIEKVDFSTSVVMWHLITHMYSLLGGAANKDGGGGGSRDYMLLAMEVSNYLMDLVLERRVLISSEGHVVHHKAREEVKQILAEHGKKVDADDAEAVREVLEAGMRKIREPAVSSETGVVTGGLFSYGLLMLESGIYTETRAVLPDAWRLAHMLLSSEDPGTSGEVEEHLDLYQRDRLQHIITAGGDRVWQLVASVWIEMLFHLATKCEAGFHAKKLRTGGEFITHVRMLLLNRGFGWNAASVPLLFSYV